MLVYILLLGVVVLCCLLESFVSVVSFSRIKINSRTISFWIPFVFILLLGLFRNELLGVDVGNYQVYFTNRYNHYDFSYILAHFDLDNGYIFLNKVISIFTSNFFVFKTIVYLITFGLFSLIIYKNSKYPALSYLIYIGIGFLGINFCLLRQALAYSICFWGFKFFELGKKKIFILTVLLAMTIHKTAIFFILAYPLTRKMFKQLSIFKKVIIVAIFIGFSLFILPELYSFYRNDYSEVAEKGEGGMLLVFYLLIIFIMSVIKRKREIKMQTENLRYEASFCTLYFQIGALFFSLFTRIANYYALLFTLSIPEAIGEGKNRKTYMFIFLFSFSFLYIYNLYADPCQITPYISIFNNNLF